MKTDQNFVALTSATSGLTVRLMPIHIVAIVPSKVEEGSPGSIIVTTPGVQYVVEESPEAVERIVADVLG